MKQSFPSKPSVEHLKKQAKALLKSCRSGDTEAHQRLSQHHPRYASGVKQPDQVALQEAQHVVAREYGCNSWPHLMASLHGKPVGSPPDTSRILVYTNGHSAVDLLDAAAIPGEKLEWLEVLHDGPVPMTSNHDELYQIRATHFASLGWTSVEGALEGFVKRDAPLSRPNEYDELQLWFEHDLFDQLQLIQLLDRLAGMPGWKTKVALYQFDTFLGHLHPEQLERYQPSPIRVSHTHTDLARETWNAFREESPENLWQLTADDLSALPFLKPALLRLFQEFPSTENGLGRTEGQILSNVSAGKRGPQEIFRDSQDQEEAQFMGDSSFYAVLQRLTLGPQPALRTESGEPFRTPAEVGYTQAFREQRILLSPTGQNILQGNADWLTILPVPYWIGGVRIEGPNSPRWDSNTLRF